MGDKKLSPNFFFKISQNKNLSFRLTTDAWRLIGLNAQPTLDPVDESSSLEVELRMNNTLGNSRMGLYRCRIVLCRQ